MIAFVWTWSPAALLSVGALFGLLGGFAAGFMVADYANACPCEGDDECLRCNSERTGAQYVENRRG